MKANRFHSFGRDEPFHLSNNITDFAQDRTPFSTGDQGTIWTVSTISEPFCDQVHLNAEFPVKRGIREHHEGKLEVLRCGHDRFSKFQIPTSLIVKGTMWFDIPNLDAEMPGVCDE